MSTVGVGSILFLKAKNISSSMVFPSSTLEYAFTEAQEQNFAPYLLTGHFLLRVSQSNNAVSIFEFEIDWKTIPNLCD